MAAQSNLVLFLGCTGFLYLGRVGAALGWGAQASPRGGLSPCRARALGRAAQ